MKTCYQSKIFPLSRKVDLGLLLLIELARENNTISIKTIAEKKGTSTFFLQKIAQKLKKSGLIEAERGIKGGYRLKKRAEDISLKEIIEALEGRMAVVPCLKEHIAFICEIKDKCPIQPGMKSLNAEIQNIFLSKTLHSFIS